MDEAFDLPVSFNGKEMEFKGRLVTVGFTHKILVEVNGSEISFEPDEERNYRAIIHTDDPNRKDVDTGLLQAITETIEGIFKG